MSIIPIMGYLVNRKHSFRAGYSKARDGKTIVPGVTRIGENVRAVPIWDWLGGWGAQQIPPVSTSLRSVSRVGMTRDHLVRGVREPGYYADEVVMARMTRQVSELLKKAMALSSFERGLLIDRPTESLDDEPAEEGVEAAWDEEIKRRIDDIRTGRVKMIPGEQVLREMAERFPDVVSRLKERRGLQAPVKCEDWFAKLDQFNTEPFAPTRKSSSGRRGSRRRRG